MQRLDALSVVGDVFVMASQPGLQGGRRFVGLQIQGKTVKHLARIPLGPHTQPMLTRFSRGIRVHDVTLGTRRVGIGGKAVAGDRAVERTGQCGVMPGQLIQLTGGQDDFFHVLFLAVTVVHVVEDGLVAVHFQQVLEFSVDDDGDVDGRIGTKVKHQLQLSAQLGVQHGTVQKTVGRVVKCEQRETATLAPFLSRHHVSLVLSQAAGGFEEAMITSHVQLIAGVVQFQGLVRVLLALHQLFDAGESKLLKGKRILFHVPVECRGLHQSHHQQVGRSILKRIVDLEQPFGGTQIVGTQFASHRGVTHHALVHGDGQIFVEILVDLDLAQQQSDLHVGHVEAHGVRAPVADGEEFRRVEEQLDADLHLGHQQFTQVKHLDHGSESQHVRLVDVLAVFLPHLLEGEPLRLGQGQMVGVRGRQLIGGQLTDGWIQSVHPSLRFQDGLSVVPVKIQCRVYQGLVGVGVRLRTDERVVESHADLLEEGVGKVVGEEDGRGVGGRQGGPVRFLQFQFQLEFALTQIDVFGLRIYLKVHRCDARGERMDGHLASAGDAKIRRRNLEQVQHGRHDGFGTRYDGSRTHDVVACNPKEGMRSTSRFQSLLTTSSATSRRSSSSGLTSSTFFLEKGHQIHAWNPGGSAPQRSSPLRQVTNPPRIDGTHSTRRGP